MQITLILALIALHNFVRQQEGQDTNKYLNIKERGTSNIDTIKEDSKDNEDSKDKSSSV